MTVPSYLTTGSKTSEIEVDISYRIIDLFSNGLYKSPYKAIEELVSNSFDADAGSCFVFIPNPIEVDSEIWVIDTGHGMNASGLEDLWKIAHSEKRTAETSTRKRIGKFGIGKLATYVLAKKMTHLTCDKKTVRAVTMDYNLVQSDADGFSTKKLRLDVRKLSRAQQKRALASAKSQPGFTYCNVEGALTQESSWTAVVLGSLRPGAQQLKMGRLQWILSTALPNNPRFKLFLNGERVHPSISLKAKRIRAWTIGVDEPDYTGTELDSMAHGSDKSGPFVLIPEIEGKVRGRVELFEDNITKGKSRDLGRSHGFFVFVRGRLVNEDDALFGLPALSHGAFARFRMEIHADGLDHYLTSGREGIRESPGVQSLRRYMQSKFNEARTALVRHTEKLQGDSIPGKLSSISTSLMRRPLYRFVKHLLESPRADSLMFPLPAEMSAAERQEQLSLLDARIESGSSIITGVEIDEEAPVSGLVASYDLLSSSIRINPRHPFVANYLENRQGREILEVIASSEVLLESILYDRGVTTSTIRKVIQTRDELLKQLVLERPRGAAAIALALAEAQDDEEKLESTVCEAFRSLGYHVVREGKSGKPDGIAEARLGVRRGHGNQRYRVTLEAKSTGKKRVAAQTLNIASIPRHRRLYDAKYSVVVAPGFQGDDDPMSSANTQARETCVTLMNVRSLARLVQVAPLRQLGLARLADLFAKAFTPVDVDAWIDDLESEHPPVDISTVLDVIDNLLDDPNDDVHLSVVRHVLKTEHSISLSEPGLRECLCSIQQLAPGYVHLDDVSIYLDAPVAKIRDALVRIGEDSSDTSLVSRYLSPIFGAKVPTPPKRKPVRKPK